MVIYDGCREAYLDGNAGFDADNIVVKAMNSGYIPSRTTHRYGNDLGAPNIIATSSNLSGKGVSAGVAKASNVTFTAPPGPGPIVGFVLVDTSIDGGNGGRLLCYIGQDNLGAPISIPTDGVNNVVIRFGAGTTNIFKL